MFKLTHFIVNYYRPSIEISYASLYLQVYIFNWGGGGMLNLVTTPNVFLVIL